MESVQRMPLPTCRLSLSPPPRPPQKWGQHRYSDPHGLVVCVAVAVRLCTAHWLKISLHYHRLQRHRRSHAHHPHRKTKWDTSILACQWGTDFLAREQQLGRQWVGPRLSRARGSWEGYGGSSEH